MALAYPHDPHIWDELVEHQYCFGAELLVAPVYSAPSQQRYLYLPPGGWLDFWTGQAYAGGQTVRVPADLDQIPVFARAGAVIPLLDPSPETLLPADDPAVRQAGPDLRLQIYPGADGVFEMYDGSRFEWQAAQNRLRVSGMPAERWLAVRCLASDRPPARVETAGGRPVTVVPGSLGGDARFVRFQASPAEVYFVQY
jgi:alpha-D-xyloside xylohydrolase